MPKLVRHENWSLGSNNVAGRAQLPVDRGVRSVREAVNVDIMNGGEFRGRIGYELIEAATTPRGLCGLGKQLFYASGTALKKHNLVDGTTTTAATIPGYGELVGVVHAGELFMSVAGTQLRYDGVTLREWGVPTVVTPPTYTITLTPGLDRIPAGDYEYAATVVNAYGEESGVLQSGTFTMTDDGTIVFANFPALPTDGSRRLYVSTQSGTTKYLQAETTASSVSLSNLTTSGMVLETQFLRTPPAGTILASYHGVILIGDGQTVWVTTPMRPHLIDMMTGWYQYPAHVTNILPVEDGVYITADKTYFLSDLETDTPTQRVLYDFGAVAKSGVAFGDKVAWLTEYGQAIGQRSGQVEFPNRNFYSPLLATKAAAGIVRHNGLETIVTALREPPEASSLAAADYYDSDVILTGTVAGGTEFTDTYTTEVVDP